MWIERKCIYDLFVTVARRAVGPNLPLTKRLSPRVKWLESETKRSSPSNAEVKNAWSFTTTFPTHFCGVARRPRCSFFLPYEIITDPVWSLLLGNNLTRLSPRLIILCADHSGLAVWGMNCLWSLERCERGFESDSSHGCLCAFILCLCCSVCR
jgi:hypothetical protein